MAWEHLVQGAPVVMVAQEATHISTLLIGRPVSQQQQTVLQPKAVEVASELLLIPAALVGLLPTHMGVLLNMRAVMVA